MLLVTPTKIHYTRYGTDNLLEGGCRMNWSVDYVKKTHPQSLFQVFTTHPWTTCVFCHDPPLGWLLDFESPLLFSESGNKVFVSNNIYDSLSSNYMSFTKRCVIFVWYTIKHCVLSWPTPKACFFCSIAPHFHHPPYNKWSIPKDVGDDTPKIDN